MERNTITYAAAVSALRDRRALATSGGALGRDGTLSSGTEHHHVQCSILLREKASHVMTKYSNNVIVLSNCIITSLHCFYVAPSVLLFVCEASFFANVDNYYVVLAFFQMLKTIMLC